MADALRHAPLQQLSALTDECDDRIGDAWTPEERLLGVTNEAGLTTPKTTIGKEPGRYKIVKNGYLVYNPMRINIGSIGVSLTASQTGIVSPDYVVFRCRDGLSPEYLFYYLRSEAGRHAIRMRTKGSVRFRLYYERLASVEIPLPLSLELQEDFAARCREIDALRHEAFAIERAAMRLLLSFQGSALDRD